MQFEGSLLEEVCAKDTVATALNDRRPVPGRHEMRDAGWYDHEAAGRICLQPGRVESVSRAQIPGPLDDRHDLVVRMGMREDALAAGDLDPIDRSEEHTSELQVTSGYLVCRLLL